MDPYLGEIRLFSHTVLPSGWTPCDGRLLNINFNQPLYALLGAQYGGDGQVTFALPDLRGRTPMQFGSGNHLAESGGTETVALTLDQVPPHSHQVRVSGSVGSLGVATGAYPAGVAADSQSPPVTPPLYGAPNPGATVALVAETVGSAGSGLGHNNMQPSLVLVFAMATSGAFPQRS